MPDRPTIERVASLEAADQYEKNEIYRMQGVITSQAEQLAILMKWKTECDNSNKLLVKILLFVSALATLLGTWIGTIKQIMKSTVQWASQ